MTIGILPNVNYVSLNRVVNSAISARLHTGRLKVNPAKSRRRMVTKVQWLYRISGHRSAGIFTDFTEEHTSLGINSTSAIHKSYAASRRHPRTQKGPSLGKIQVKISHQRSPYAVKIEDRSQEEAEKQERCAHGDAWRLAKNNLKLKEKDKATFFSNTNEWCLQAPSVIKPEEREFVVDSGASMHMLSRKDLNSADLEFVKVSESPTTVVTANGEVQTKEDSDSVCQRIGFIRDSNASRRYTSRSLTRKTLRGSWVHVPLDQRSENTTHQRGKET